MCLRPLLFGKSTHQLFFDIEDVIFLFGQSQPAGDPGDMGIHGQCRFAETDCQHDTCRLASDAGQRFQFDPALRHFSAVFLTDLPGHGDQIAGLVAVKTDRTDIGFDLRG